MFEFTSKAKTFAIALFAVGLIGVIAGFVTNGSVDHEDHSSHDMHATHEGHDTPAEEAHDKGHDAHSEEGHHGEVHADDHHAEAAGGHAASHDDHGNHHGLDAETIAHQKANRPWSALFLNAFFWFSIGLGALFFLSIQYAASAGWTAGLLRIFEAVALWLIIPGLVIVAIFILGGYGHMHHMYHWMAEGIADPASPNYDSIIAGKVGYLNVPFFLVRALIYLGGWYFAARYIRKNTLAEDTNGGDMYYRKNFKASAIFLVFFAVTSSMMAWDWIMSIDAHWFSTLFGWYTFAGLFVSALTALNLIIVYLKNKGYMEWINENHLHDMGKFMFAFSVFWTYLWFSQFMLIWYSDIPEEVTYYMQRFGEYKLPFFIMVALNFIFPVLLIMSRDAKRNYPIIMFTGIIVLLGHWLDHFVMIMPGTVGNYWGFGLVEVFGFIMFMGLFIYVVFTNLSKAPLHQKNHPMSVESEHFTL
mgnify:CR=1 FL=1